MGRHSSGTLSSFGGYSYDIDKQAVVVQCFVIANPQYYLTQPMVVMVPSFFSFNLPDYKFYSSDPLFPKILGNNTLRDEVGVH